MFFVATAPCLDESGEGGHVNVSPKGYRDTFAILDPQTVAYLDLTGSGAETIAHLRQNGRITVMFCSFDRQPKILRIYGAGRVILPEDPCWPEYAGYFPSAASAAAEADVARGTHEANGAGETWSEAGANGAGAEGVRAEGARANGAGANGAGAADDRDGDLVLDLEHGIDRGNHRAIIVVTADRISDSCGYAVPCMELTEERDLLTRWADRRSPEDLVDYRIKHNTYSIDGLPALG
jgi:hypothetical protein